jgi:hypothetical protein
LLGPSPVDKGAAAKHVNAKNPFPGGFKQHPHIGAKRAWRSSSKPSSGAHSTALPRFDVNCL